MCITVLFFIGYYLINITLESFAMMQIHIRIRIMSPIEDYNSLKNLEINTTSTCSGHTLFMSHILI
jgi:hypothetical protein